MKLREMLQNNLDMQHLKPFDAGIGPYEFWGSRGYDSSIAWEADPGDFKLEITPSEPMDMLRTINEAFKLQGSEFSTIAPNGDLELFSPRFEKAEFDFENKLTLVGYWE
jgi:hypothetical protein